MADSRPITRRAAFTGALASAAALAVPAVAAVSKGDKLRDFLDNATPDELIQYHANRLAEALCEARPGLWRFTLGEINRSGFVAFNHTDASFTGYAQDFQ